MRHAGEVSICGKNWAYWCQILIGCFVFPVVSVTQSWASQERMNQDPFLRAIPTSGIQCPEKMLPTPIRSGKSHDSTTSRALF